ncbi:MAG: hypothetical protein JW797_12965 [Bradymonadales bacterium]|nr:hypothetical protein [Bradymonadales bacterium]
MRDRVPSRSGVCRGIASFLIMMVAHWGGGCRGCPPAPPSTEGEEGIEGGRLVFQDDFERADLGESWRCSVSAWRIEEGGVTVQRARNAPLWLTFPLPERVRVEFDAVALSSVGDLKFEIFSNGQDHGSGYICILGGWNNSATVIARLDEHGEDRLDASRHELVVPQQTYHFTAVRTDHRLRWYVDGNLLLSYDDPQPLSGPEHQYFAFNNWEAPARFDNLRVFDLAE